MRYRFFGRPVLLSLVQVVGGGALVFAAEVTSATRELVAAEHARLVL